ncbi:MAG: NADH-quinone oxidoreductase subunit NuoB [Candidatus Moranbacteria bacterium]|nr:NADH-quinone oxidoreductase subunit NuoB [Candidatus Moranbacteria bacterium]
MYRLLRKIVKTPKLVIPKEELLALEYRALGEKMQDAVKGIFGGSLAIREVAAGSSNAEEQELTALGNVYYDVERFGIHFVASPRHADMLFVTGPVSRNMAEGLRHTYEAMPTPRFVVAVGDGAIDGGIYRGSYAIHNSVEEIIPVDYKIPGDPPSPKMVLASLLHILENIESESSGKK